MGVNSPLQRTRIIFVALILIVLAGLAILFINVRQKSNELAPTPSPSPTPSASPIQQTVEYLNTQYGFAITLPQSWQGYSIVTEKWVGEPLGPDSKVQPEGPEILIRHPQWTKEDPRQDIPVMIFTIDQWSTMQNGVFHIGAAPINPSELGRNSKYVFALPARYNYSFPTGYQEVEQILAGKPFKFFD